MKKTNNTNIDGAPAGSIRTNSGTFFNVLETIQTVVQVSNYL
jgi:hypothetical protein